MSSTGRPSRPPAALTWSRQMSSPACTCRPAGAVAPVRLKLRPILIGSAARADASGKSNVAAAITMVPARSMKHRTLCRAMSWPPRLPDIHAARACKPTAADCSRTCLGFRDPQAVLVRLVDHDGIDVRLELGHQSASAIEPDLDHVGLARRHLTNRRARRLSGVRSRDAALANWNSRRRGLTSGHAEALVGTEEVGAGNAARVQLRTQFVEQRSVEAERHDRGDAVGLDLLQLPQDGIAVVVLGSCLEADEDADMRVVRDEARHDGFAGVVDDLRIGRNRGCGRRTYGDDAAVAHD